MEKPKDMCVRVCAYACVRVCMQHSWDLTYSAKISLFLTGGKFSIAQKAAEGEGKPTSWLRRKVVNNSQSITLF